MEKYIYRPVRFYLITFACTWFWWLFAILLNEGTGLYLGMFLGLVSPAMVAVVTVFTSKNKALINDFKKKLIGFYRIKPKYILIAVLIFAVIYCIKDFIFNAIVIRIISVCKFNKNITFFVTFH